MGDSKGARELRKAGAECFAKCGISNVMALNLQACDSFETLILLESDTRSVDANAVLTDDIQAQVGIYEKFSAFFLGHRPRFADRLARLWSAKEPESGKEAAARSVQKDERSQESEQTEKGKKLFSDVDWKEKTKERKEKKENNLLKKKAKEVNKGSGSIEKFRVLSGPILKLACLFGRDRTYQLSRPLGLLYTRQFDECISECEYLLACEVPAGGGQAASDEELMCFDLGLKAILAQALAFCGDGQDVPSLARANMIYSTMTGDSQVTTRCVSAFPVMHHLMEDLAAAKENCLRRLTEATELFPGAYTRYATAAAKQKKGRSEFIRQTQKLIHRLAQASSTYSKSIDLVQSHRQRYCKAYAEVTKDAKHLSAVGE